MANKSLIEPHGGILVERYLDDPPKNIDKLTHISLSRELQMDVEQIAIGTFSPLEGFMVEKDFHSVLDQMRLENGIIWTLPIVLDIFEEQAQDITIGEDVALTNEKNETIAILHVEDKFTFDKEDLVEKMYCTNDECHPGIQMVKEMKPVLLGGKIDLLKRREPKYKRYELTPQQVRKSFEERNWSKVVGFHTRNVIHRGHEFIQMQAMKQHQCDGLFVQPIIGKKKTGDFEAEYIVKTYERMMQGIYPENRVKFGLLSTFSRYAGPREAIFTALCRQNYGCSHFVVGRDHTGTGDFYHPHASHQIFDSFPDILITPIKFDKVFYSSKFKKYMCINDTEPKIGLDEQTLSGTAVRELFQSLKAPPEWFMRTEISDIILDSLKHNETVFVK